jgi:membrane-bound serine protease (ClpP class)
MAPGTNVGAATPVQLGGISPPDDKDKAPAKTSSNKDNMQRKVINDAVAYIRGLAALHGRNQEWAEKAVVKGDSIPASEALQLKVIDIIANNIDDLLKQIDGREVLVQGQKRTLHTANLAVQTMEPDWRSRFLSVITNPNVAYILMLIGIYGLILEFSNPGAIVPGTVGAISLLLALYAFQLLPINYVGMGLILLGIGLMIAEAYAPSFGILGIGGVVAFAIGSVILIDTEAPGFGINLSVILSFSIISALIFILVVGMAIKARRRPVVAGREELIGSEGIVLQDFDDKGPVKVHSEIWQAKTKYPLHKGQSIKVIASKGLLLEVVPLESFTPSPLQEKQS